MVKLLLSAVLGLALTKGEVEAAPAFPSTIAPLMASAAGDSPCGPGASLTIGYEEGLPLGEPEADTQARRLLTLAFPECVLSFRSLHRADVAPSVLAHRVELGLLGVPVPAALASQRSGQAVLGSEQLAGIDSLPVSPLPYAVVVRQAETTGLEPSVSWLGRWARRGLGASLSTPVKLLLGVVAGVFALIVALRLVNLRLPAFSRMHYQPVQRVDPRLVRSTRVWRWIARTRSGRGFGLLWAGLGACAVWLAQSEQTVATEHASLRPRHYASGAERAAYPGRTLFEFLGDAWRACDQPHECLHNLVRGEASALAGSRDLLCFHARKSGLGELAFDPNVAPAPMLQVFLLPSEASDSHRALRASLLGAMRTAAERAQVWGKCP